MDLPLPVLLAGRGGGIHDPGRYWVEPNDRSIGDLWLTFLQATGGAETSFGLDGVAPLTLTA